ncbi:MAG: winged helix-turn-helix domain-containing protein [Blastocatellia bacterium]
MDKQDNNIREFGTWRVDAVQRLLFHEGRHVPLPPKVFETLLALIERPGELVSKEELMERVWPDTFVEEINLTKNISVLRRTLANGDGQQEYIVTIPKRGYRFVSLVTEAEGRLNGQPSVGAESGHDLAALAAAENSSAPVSVIPRRRRIIAGLVVLLAVVIAVTGYWWRAGTKEPKTSGQAKTIAVLPFKYLGSNTEDEYLVVGMTDELVTRLSHIRQLTVRPANAVLKYQNRSVDAQTAGAELQVDAVLSGSVQKVNGRLRLHVQLVRSGQSRPVQAGEFEEADTDLLALQDSITAQVTQWLALKLSSAEQQLVRKRYTENAQAYQAWLQGQYHYSKKTVEGSRKALAYYQQALTHDPRYAPAYAQMALAWQTLMERLAVSREEGVRNAREAARRALELDETLSDAHAALALFAYLEDWDLTTAEHGFRRALELEPHQPTTLHLYGVYLLARGRADEGVEMTRRAVRIDPLTISLRSQLSRALYLAHRYDEAITEAQAALLIDPAHISSTLYLGQAYAQKGSFAEALIALRKAQTLPGTNVEVVAALAHACALAGQADEARRLLRELEQKSAEPSVSYHIATVHAGLGERAETFTWLENSYGRREAMLISRIKTDPKLDPLRHDPEFAGLLRRIGLD